MKCEGKTISMMKRQENQRIEIEREKEYRRRTNHALQYEIGADTENQGTKS